MRNIEGTDRNQLVLRSMDEMAERESMVQELLTRKELYESYMKHVRTA